MSSRHETRRVLEARLIAEAYESDRIRRSLDAARMRLRYAIDNSPFIKLTRDQVERMPEYSAARKIEGKLRDNAARCEQIRRRLVKLSPSTSN